MGKSLAVGFGFFSDSNTCDTELSVMGNRKPGKLASCLGRLLFYCFIVL